MKKRGQGFGRGRKRSKKNSNSCRGGGVKGGEDMGPGKAHCTGGGGVRVKAAERHTGGGKLNRREPSRRSSKGGFKKLNFRGKRKEGNPENCIWKGSEGWGRRGCRRGRYQKQNQRGRAPVLLNGAIRGRSKGAGEEKFGREVKSQA